jgi:hypothetical protein
MQIGHGLKTVESENWSKTVWWYKQVVGLKWIVHALKIVSSKICLKLSSGTNVFFGLQMIQDSNLGLVVLKTWIYFVLGSSLKASIQLNPKQSLEIGCKACPICLGGCLYCVLKTSSSQSQIRLASISIHLNPQRAVFQWKSSTVIEFKFRTRYNPSLNANLRDGMQRTLCCNPSCHRANPTPLGTTIGFVNSAVDIRSYCLCVGPLPAVT